MSANLKKILSRKKIVYVSEEAFNPGTTPYSRKDSYSVTFSFKGMPKGERGYEKRRETLEYYRKKIHEIADGLGLGFDMTLSVRDDFSSIGFHPEITIEGLPPKPKNKSVQFLKQVEKLIGYRGE